MARKASADTTLAEIAKQLNLSISTVSRALRNADGIHAETRSRVLDIAGALGYNTKAKKQGESAQPRHILALTQWTNPSSDRFYLAGMSSAALDLNFAIHSHHVTADNCGNLLDPKFQPSALKSGLVEGLILIHRWPPEVALMLSQKWPTVSIMHQYPDTLIDHVGIDDRSGMWSVVNNLRAAGHRKIGFFGLCKEMSWSCSRYSGYVEALMRCDLPYDPQNVIEVSLAGAMASDLILDDEWEKKVMARIKDKVDAWVCSSEGTSHTLARFLMDQGLKFPDDISIVCFHQSENPPRDLPVLTSTKVADEEIGSAALRRLTDRLANPGDSQRAILLASKFVQGETTRAV